MHAGLKPQERANHDQADYPTIAPASARRGRSTTAPDNAPSAASPPRSCAIVADGSSNSANAAIAVVFFIRVRSIQSRNKAKKCGGERRDWVHADRSGRALGSRNNVPWPSRARLNEQ